MNHAEKIKKEGFEYSISIDDRDVCSVEVKVDNSYVEQFVENKLNKYAESKRMKGFRSGKNDALASILKASIGNQTKKNSEEEIIDGIVNKILTSENLTVLQNKDFKKYDSQSGLKFTVSFYTIPKPIKNFEGLSGIEIEDYEVDIETSLDEYIDTCSKNAVRYVKIENKDYVIKKDDKVVFEVYSTIDNKIFKKCCSDNYSHTITDNKLDNLSYNAIGLSIGGEKTFEFTPRPESVKPKLRNKKISMTIRVKSLESAEKSLSREDFLNSIDTDIDKAIDTVKKNMKKEIDFYVSNLRKFNVIKALGKIGENFQIHDDIINNKLPSWYKDKTEEEKAKILKETRELTVATFFNIEFGKRFNVKISPEEIENFIRHRIASSGNDIHLEAKKYQENPGLVRNIRDSIYEGRVIGLIFNQMKKNIRKLNFGEIIKVHDNVTS